MTAKHRVFFVSAKEAVIVREQQRKLEQEEEQRQDRKSKMEVGKGLADGWRARLMEFERLAVIDESISGTFCDFGLKYVLRVLNFTK